MSIEPLRGISSMATRAPLAELVAAWADQHGQPVRLESVGGVDAARRVAAGEPFDFVVLSQDAIGQLVAGGHAASPRDLARSSMAACVPAGAPRLPFATADDVRRALLTRHPVGYSTGPSGAALLALLRRWGIFDAVSAHLVQAPPGRPVAAMVAAGEVALGFQQLSELLPVAGIDILGPLPPGIEVTTVFSAAVCTGARQPRAAAELLDFLRSAAADACLIAHGLVPARLNP